MALVSGAAQAGPVIKPDFYRLLIDVDLRDAEHLHMILSTLEAESNVASVERRRDPGLAQTRAAAE